MNAIYKLVWSVATGKLVVASELAKGRKKMGGRKALFGALAIALAGSAPIGAAFAASTTAAATCITVDGQFGSLNTAGVRAADARSASAGGPGRTCVDRIGRAWVAR